MYITIFKIDIEKPIVCKALIDAAEMHRQVQKLFNSGRQEHRILYRLDQGYLIVQSEIKPICEGVFEQIAQYNMSEKTRAWKNGSQFKFRIKAVPRKSMKGKKHYIHTKEGRIEWLKKQFEKNGMELLAVRESMVDTLTISSKVNLLTGGDTKVSAWEYEGVFSISDKEVFIRSYEQGIGSQKAYGCGMICLCG